MTDEEHNKYIAWVFIAHGIFQILILAFMFVVLGIMFFSNPDPDFPHELFLAIFGAVLAVNFLFLLPNFVAAYAMLKQKSWARVMAIVASVLAVMSVPTGTVAGVYALWYFLGDKWRSVYEPHKMQGNDFYLNSSINSSPAGQRWEGRYVNEHGEEVYRQPEIPDWR